MITEIYIENYRLDVYKDLSALLNFAIDDIKDFSARSTTWSQTIVLPGTANNNKLFGHIFELGQANAYDPDLPNVAYNFNASKGADCIIFQDNLQTFKGVLRLLEVISDKGQLEYEVAVFGEISALNVALSGGLLEDLDFSAYDHDYTVTNIIASWDNTPGTGYTYPLIDYGGYSTNSKKNWDYRTFRPALYAREYLDKMFTAAGFTFESDLFDTDRFKGLIIPANKKELVQVSSPRLSALRSLSYLAISTSQSSAVVKFSSYSDYGFSASADKDIFTYDLADSIIFNGTIALNGTYSRNNGSGLPMSVSVQFLVNGVIVSSTSITATPGQANKAWSVSLTPTNFTISAGDTIQIYLQKNGGNPLDTFSLTIQGASLGITTDATTFIPLEIGNPLTINAAIPKGIRQIDFLVSIVKLFNLYVYEDKFNSRLIYIKPYVDYYDNATVVDWTYKLNRDKPVRIKPLSELNAKIYEFKYKPDTDFYNDLYKKRYGQTYGDFIYDSEFEFAEQKNSLELIFSPTPLVGYLGEDKIFSTIFKMSNDIEEPTDSNIRILQAKKISSINSWSIKDNATILSTQSSYMYAGHLNDPDAPADDLNFGVSKELFFSLTTGDLSVNQFNVYWSEYMADITDKDSKLLSGYFYLTPKDIFNLNFASYIQVDGVTFRLNKISEYNTYEPDDCKVELLKVAYAPAGSQIDFDIWSQDGDNLVDDGSNNDIQITA